MTCPLRMAFKLVAALLILSLIKYSQCRERVDLSNGVEIGTTDYKGTKLRVYEQDGVQFAEPNIQLDKFCGIISYNYVYRKYEFAIPVIVEANTLQNPIENSKQLGSVQVSKLDVHIDDALASEDSKVRVLVQQRRGESAQLLFLCDEFERCDRLRIELVTNPHRMQWALQFSAIGVVSGGLRVKFGAQSSSNPPPAIDCITEKWVVFQRRIDAKVSFVQNWETYVKGFGNSHSNYWMGLKQLSALTVTSEHTDHGNTGRCQFRAEGTDWHGNKHFAHFKYFQVLTSEQDYRLRIMEELPGSTMQQISYNHEMRFSTFDKDNDAWGGGSVSRLYGHGGWWFNHWAPLNANGNYPPKEALHKQLPAYMTALVSGKHLVLTSTVLMFKCG